jgi:hypothetical protein
LARSTVGVLAVKSDLSKRGVGLVVPSMGGERLIVAMDRGGRRSAARLGSPLNLG